MKIIPASSFKRSPWKNGGGITHEIARDRQGNEFGWRLSIAAVSSDGPFSLFPGYQRCLTVIAGHGMELTGPEMNVNAGLFAPVWFSGDVAFTCKLIEGPCLDFNVIFNPDIYRAEVEILNPQAMPICGRVETLTGLYQLNNAPSLSEFIILETPEDEFELMGGSRAILLRLSPHKL
jgi:uncharacterized protein